MDEYEKYLPIVIEMNKSNTHNHNSAMRGRAQAYFVMAEFQKDGYIKAELCEKSLKLFNKVLKEDFTNEKVQQYFQNDVKCCVFLYGSIVNQNSENYKTVIGVKVENIMNMPPDSKETKLLIKELNSMRRDYAVQLLGFEKFAENNLPELYSPDRMMKLYFDIATQFRSIILNNEKNHQHNLARSYSILMLLADASKSVAELREVWIEANVEDNDYVQGFVDELVREIDQHPFIKRFRKDFTTMP